MLLQSVISYFMGVLGLEWELYSKFSKKSNTNSEE